MATLEDIEVYESLNFASVVSYDLDALETFFGWHRPLDIQTTRKG